MKLSTKHSSNNSKSYKKYSKKTTKKNSKENTKKNSKNNKSKNNKKLQILYDRIIKNFANFQKNHKLKVSKKFKTLSKSIIDKNSNLSLVDLYFMDEEKLCKVFHKMLKKMIKEYIKQGGKIHKRKSNSSKSNSRIFKSSKSKSKKSFQLKGGRLIYVKEDDLLSCNNIFDECDDEQECIDYNDLGDKSKTPDCVEESICGPQDPISLMTLGKGDNIWKNTMTKDCYERDNLNGTLYTNMKDPTTGLKVRKIGMKKWPLLKKPRIF